MTRGRAVDALLETDELVKRRRRTLAVDGVSLRVHPGEVVGLLGPNGAGKTTTLRCLLGLVRPTSGECRVLGRRTPGDTLHHMGSMIEDPALYPWMTAGGNLEALAGVRLGAARIGDELARVGLAAVGNKRVRAFSQGMKQRLALAVALAPDPRALVLDEPMNGLDPAGVREFRGLIRDAAARGVGVLLSSHQLGEMEKACDRVVVLDHGRVVAEGALEDLTGGDRLEVRLGQTENGIRDRARAALGSRLAGEPEPGVFVVTGATGAQVSELLAREGVYPESVRELQLTLEDQFFALTDR